MNCVPAEISKKIGVFLEYQNVDIRAGQQKTKYHPGGTATDHTTTRFDLIHRFERRSRDF
jgi:hypothetical protein